MARIVWRPSICAMHKAPHSLKMYKLTVSPLCSSSRRINGRAIIAISRVRAKALARRGELAEADRLAREAVAMLAASDYLDAHASAVADLGEVLHLAGKLQESAAVSAEAIRMYEEKGNIAVASARRAALAERQLEV